MNWKIILVSVIAFVIIIGLVSFQAIGIDLGIVPLFLSLLGIVAPIINDLRKPKISLEIEKPEFEKREYGDLEGYKIVTKVTNNGNKIVFNLEASANFKEQIDVSKVNILTRNKQKSYSISNHPFEEDKYSWIDGNGKTIGNTFSQLRKNDSIKLMFPTEYKSGFGFIIGTIGSRSSVSHGSANDTLLNLEPQRTYKVEVEVKGEDNDKNTVIKKKNFKIKIPTNAET